MTLRPNRINTSRSLTPAREQQLAQQLLNVQSEEELDHFLPLIAAAAPMIANIAGPLLKNLAGGLFGGGGGGRKKRRPRDEQEQFLGKIAKSLLGESQAENYEEEQFLGGILKGLLGGGRREMETEQQQFLGSLVGKLLGREAETENYVQEQFLGGILKGLLGGGREMESETESEWGSDQAKLMHRARRFVQVAHGAANYARNEFAKLQRTGRQPNPLEVRRIVLQSILASARRFAPQLAAAAFPTGAARDGHPSAGPAPGQGPGRTVLDRMIAEATPLGTPPAPSRPNGYNALNVSASLR